MAKNADYRKHNDRTQNSSTYHKKDGTNVRAKLKQEAKKQAHDALCDICDLNKATIGCPNGKHICQECFDGGYDGDNFHDDNDFHHF